MGRPGRKRKAGRRHPNGALVREKRPDDRIRASRQPHRRAMTKDDRLDERAESALGRLNLRRLISNDEYDAGLRYAAVVGAYRAAIEAPTSTAGSGRGFECLAESFAHPDACRADPDGCACRRRRSRYDSAFECLLREAGQRGAKVVARVAVHGEEIAQQDLVYLKAGLQALEHHFGLTRRGTSGHSQNAH